MSSAPVAYEVWWGLAGAMRRDEQLFRDRADAKAYADLIKSNTEVRPLYAGTQAGALTTALSAMVAAWDALPVGNHDAHVVNNWLCSDEWREALQSARAALSGAR